MHAVTNIYVEEAQFPEIKRKKLENISFTHFWMKKLRDTIID